MSEDRNINIVLGKPLRVLPEVELFEPVCNLLHRRPRRLLVALVSRQLLQQRLRLLQIARVEPLSEPAVDLPRLFLVAPLPAHSSLRFYFPP